MQRDSKCSPHRRPRECTGVRDATSHFSPTRKVHHEDGGHDRRVGPRRSLFVWTFAGKPTPSSAAVAPACTTANLDVWLNTTGNGAAGSSYYNLNLTNLSPHSCSLFGYPGVSAITQAGIQLGSSAGRDAEHASTRITLASARTARGFETSTSRNTATVILQITSRKLSRLGLCPHHRSRTARLPARPEESTVVPSPLWGARRPDPVLTCGISSAVRCHPVS